MRRNNSNGAPREDAAQMTTEVLEFGNGYENGDDRNEFTRLIVAYLNRVVEQGCPAGAHLPHQDCLDAQCVHADDNHGVCKERVLGQVEQLQNVLSAIHSIIEEEVAEENAMNGLNLEQQTPSPESNLGQLISIRSDAEKMLERLYQIFKAA